MFGLLFARYSLFAQYVPLHDSGQSVTAAYLKDGSANPDGSFSILFGYYNRNQKQELDIAIGPDNRIEPGGPDQGQPTHFLTKRRWGVFTVTVPKDFGSKKINWTLTANAKTTTIPAGPGSALGACTVRKLSGNTPPFLGFSATGPFVQGPRGTDISITTVGPLTLPLWVADDAHVVAGATAPEDAAGVDYLE